MRLGITGNTGKSALWASIREVIDRFHREDRTFFIDENLLNGLIERDLIDSERAARHGVSDLAVHADVILSFGGDGTILNTAHEVGDREVPILGVNLGQLGFLAHVEFQDVYDAVSKLDAGAYSIENRVVLASRSPDQMSSVMPWALNEFTLQRQGDTGLLSIEVHVDDVYLNTYWADGLIVATPTGSTAYSLALGGPIMSPGCGSVLITPMAPHSLTVRPIVIPDSSVISLRIIDTDKPYIYTADGVRATVDGNTRPIEVMRASHVVRLVQLDGQNNFASLRNKLMWGMRITKSSP